MSDVVEYIIKLKDDMSAGLKQVQAQTESLNKSVDNSNNAFNKLKNTVIGFIAAYQGLEFAKSTVQTAAQFETLNNVINYTSINAKDAAQNHEFLDRIIRDMKLPVVETTEGFSQFNAALLGSALQGEKARQVFEGVAVGTTAMHLSAQQTQQVFFALNQMMSKGTVQAQELKLQLGNALPGAARLAAKSMNMTQEAFGKAMEQGQIMAADFLPKFAEQLKKEFGGAIPNAVNSLQAKLTEANNKWIEMKLAVGELTGKLTAALLPAFIALTETISSSVKWMQENKDIMIALGSAVAVVVTSYMAYNIYLKTNTILAAANTAATFLSMVATDGLSAALYAAGIAGQVMWASLTLGLSAVVAGLVYAYYKFDKFRAFLSGVGAAIMQLKNIFVGLGEVIIGTWTIQPSMVIDGINKLKKGATDVANAYTTAYDKSMRDSAAKRAADEKQKNFDKNLKTSLTTNNQATVSNSLTSQKVSESKNTVINITMGSLVDKFTISTSNLQESSAKIREEVLKALLSAVNDSQIIATT